MTTDTRSRCKSFENSGMRRTPCWVFTLARDTICSSWRSRLLSICVALIRNPCLPGWSRTSYLEMVRPRSTRWISCEECKHYCVASRQVTRCLASDRGEMVLEACKTFRGGGWSSILATRHILIRCAIRKVVWLGLTTAWNAQDIDRQAGNWAVVRKMRSSAYFLNSLP